MKIQKTKWYPGDIKPVRKGIYQRRYLHGGNRWCNWTGEYWQIGYFGMACVSDLDDSRSFHQSLPWRGLIK